MDRYANSARFIRETCDRSDLSTYDPYDIWQTRMGFLVKDAYNRHPRLALPGAAALTLFDSYINNRSRLFYRRREYPIVRALAAQSLLNLHDANPDRRLTDKAAEHLEWLVDNSCTGFSGPCWGLGFRYAVDAGLVYGPNTPLTTMTPYALEAFVRHFQITGNERWIEVIDGIRRFLDHDVAIMEETEDYLVTSYSNQHDRKVVNAVSYVMFCYSLLRPFAESTDAVDEHIEKLYRYLALNQNPDGSWWYSPQGNSFIDCFHSCFVLKNVIKTARVVPLADSALLVEKGYDYIVSNMFDTERGLMRRFSRANKPGLIAWDLYDNAEMLNLATLRGDQTLANALEKNIANAFVDNDRIYSQIDRFGVRLGPGFLRWAILPYLFALSLLVKDSAKA